MYILRQPSNDRDWSPDQAVLPWAEIDDERIVVHNVRNATYRSADDYDVVHEDRVYELGRLRSLDFIIEPFASWRGPAHTFLSFGFDDGRYLAVSVEVRKRRGEHYSPFRGMFRAYEITYVLGDERDLIALRACHRRDEVFLYPLRATREGMRKLFLDILDRVNHLRSHPEFYNTLTNNCATNIRRHVNRVIRRRVPFSFRLMLPGFSDRLAYDLGWIDTDLPFAEARRRFRIDERVRRFADDPEFSARIRGTE